MRIIVGLGNPGTKYEKSRHNVGFMFIDYLANKWEIGNFKHSKKFDAEIADANIQGQKILLVKPQTYMNNSGRAVYKIISFYNVEPSNLIVVHDDLDIRLGEFKIHSGRGPKDHNGLLSIEENLGKKDFVRVRIGVENRSPDESITGHDYVLETFNKDEAIIIEDTITKAGEALF